MKSVCILLQSHYETDIRVTRKVEALVAAGYHVDVLALRSAYSKGKNYSVDGANLYTIALGRKRGSLARYLFEYVVFMLWAFFKLGGLMRRRPYDVIDANNLPDFLVFAAVSAKWKGAKIVFDMHEITPEFYISKYKIREDSRLVRFLKFVERKSIQFSDYVITINEPIQRLLECRGLEPSKSTIVMNSVDEAFFASTASTNVPFRRPAFVMMYHGTLTHIYGLDIALQAFGRIHDRMPGSEFWILGDGTEKGSLEELAGKLGVKSKVKFVGTVRPQEIPAWLDLCDIGVLATRQDVFLDLSFSSKLSEYIIMNKPVISSRLRTIRHYFSEEALAYFEPNQPIDLAKQMLQMYENPALRVAFAVRAKHEYEPIRWGIMKERYLALMETATRQSKKVYQRAVTPSPSHDASLTV